MPNIFTKKLQSCSTGCLHKTCQMSIGNDSGGDAIVPRKLKTVPVKTEEHLFTGTLVHADR